MTSSRLGYVLENGSVISSYHHYDGYPQYLGTILTSFFSSPADARSLVEGGDMQCCFSDTDFEGCLIMDHSKRPSRLWRPMYYSEKGLADCKPITHQGIDGFLQYCGFGKGIHFHKEKLEYAYLYSVEAWTCYDIFKSITVAEPFGRSEADAVDAIMRDLNLFKKIDGQLIWEKRIKGTSKNQQDT